MTQWSKEDLEEMCGDDVIDQLAFIAGCNKHRYSNDKVVPDGWIIPDESLRKFAGLIVRECIVDFYRNHLDTTSDEDITEQVDRYVKEHFGVEE